MDCPKCTFRNHPDIHFCEQCFARLRAPQEGKGAEASRCDICTFANHPEVAHCEMCGTERKRQALRDTHAEDSELARALEALELADKKERDHLDAIGLVGAPHVYRSPCCNIPTSIVPHEINCTIFICAVKRSFDPKASTQMGQHNEAAAAAAAAAGELAAGCGKQYLFDKGTQKLVLCTGR